MIGPLGPRRQRVAALLGLLAATRGAVGPRPAPKTPAWLRSHPWAGEPLPKDVWDHPTMISYDERALLYVLARDYVRGNGAIIDAGCFLGGSTIALAAGLAENPRASGSRPIRTYDLFDVEATYKDDYPELLDGIAPGESMRPRFEQLLGPLLGLVEVNEGDICQRRWSGEPVELLFIDICKSWAINDHVTREFFPALIPGHSVVIQQDLVHEWLPYLHITMGLFADSFELIDSVPFCSAVYLNTRAIPITRIPNSLRDELSPERKLELFEKAVRPFTGEDRGVIECSRAVLLADIGRPEEAVAHLAANARRHPRSDRVQHVGRDVLRFLETQR
jgi:hypothetical protein